MRFVFISVMVLMTGCEYFSVETKIMSKGQSTPAQLGRFLKSRNKNVTTKSVNFIAKAYVTEAYKEGVNSDIAFVQMCLETNWLRFGGQVSIEQNNFCGLGALDGGAKGASFPSVRTGVRAHIQHLKAYASYSRLRQQCVDPRFNYVKRGSAPTVQGLTKKWASDPKYDKKIVKLLKELSTYH